MTSKKQMIKHTVLILVSVIFLAMVYQRFFKAEKKSPTASTAATAPTVQPQSPPQTAQTPAVNAPGAGPGDGDRTFGDAQPVVMVFNPDIKNMFAPSNAARAALKKNFDRAAALSSLSKKTATPAGHPLSDEEKINIRQALRFKGSIISQGRALAIINGEFVHVGDRINGYTVTSITEKKAVINTGRGILALELMTHD